MQAFCGGWNRLLVNLPYGDFVDADSFNVMVLAAIAALLFGGILKALFAASWRMLHDDGRLRLRRMFARRSVSIAAAAAVAGDYEIARATRCCVACADKAQCDAWLASRTRGGFEAFCPNADLVARCTHRLSASTAGRSAGRALASCRARCDSLPVTRSDRSPSPGEELSEIEYRPDCAPSGTGSST